MRPCVWARLGGVDQCEVGEVDSWRYKVETLETAVVVVSMIPFRRNSGSAQGMPSASHRRTGLVECCWV